MANKTVADLTSKIPALTDIIPVADPTTGVAGKSLVSDVVNFGLPTQSGNSGKYLTTNGTSAYWDSNPLGTVTSVGGNGTVNGLSLSGTVTSSGNITLGGTLSGVDLTTAVSGILPVANGGTGTSNGSITGTGALNFQAGGSNQSVSIDPSGTGLVLIQGLTVGRGISTNSSTPATALGFEALNSYTAQNSYFTAVGNKALKSATVGQHSVAIGNNSLTSATTASGVTAVGSVSGAYMTGGTHCVFIGGSAGTLQDDKVTQLTDASSSIYIGYKAYGKNNNDVNSIVIGTEAVGKGANSTVIGTTSSNAAYIYCNTLNLGNGASAATITANGALTVTAGGTNQDVTLTPSGTGKVNAPAIKETVYTITDGSSVDINPANGGIQVWTLGANRTPTASSFAEGQSVTLMVDDGTAYAITWSTINPTWVGGSAPTLATTGYTVIELWKRSSTIYGALVGTV